MFILIIRSILNCSVIPVKTLWLTQELKQKLKEKKHQIARKRSEGDQAEV